MAAVDAFEPGAEFEDGGAGVFVERVGFQFDALGALGEGVAEEEELGGWVDDAALGGALVPGGADFDAGVARADVYVGNFSGLRSMVWANFCAVAGFANKKPCTRSKSIARTVKKSGRVSTP